MTAEGDQPGLSWNPDGNWLMTAERAGGRMQLVLIDLQGKRKVGYLRGSDAGAGRTNPVFSPSGRRVAFVQGEEAASSDVWVAEFPGEAPPRRISWDRTMFRGMTWVEDDGKLLVSSYRERGRAGLWLVDVDGGRKPVRLTEAVSEYRYPAYVRALRHVVYSRHTGNVAVWRRTGDWRAEGEAWIRATGLNSSAQFSPDGKRVALRSNRSGRSEIWVVEAASGEAKRLTDFDGPVTGSPRWSPDGKKIAFDSRKYGKADIFMVDAAGGEPVRLTMEAGSNEVVPSWSGDGRGIYYASDREGGDWSLWRRNLADGRDEKVVSPGFAGVELGGYLYYTRGPKDGGLYRMRLPGGTVEPVVASLRSSMWGNWAVHGREGLVYVEEDERGGMRLLRKGLEDLRKPAVEVGPVSEVVRWDGGLALSPDGKTLLLSRLGQGDSDLLWAVLP